MKVYFSGAPNESVHIEKIGGRHNMFSYYYVKLFIDGAVKVDSFIRHIKLLKKRRKHESK